MVPEDGDLGTTSEVVEGTEGVDQTPVTTPPAPEPSKGNPAWEPIRNELGDIGYSRIEKHLRDMDAEAQRRITQTNQDFAWAKELKDQGHAPEKVKQALAYANLLDSNPLQVYQHLETYLRNNGLLEAAPAATPDPNAANDPNNPDDQTPANPEIEALKQQVEQLTQQITEQAQQQTQAYEDEQADAWLDSEIENLKTANPTWDDSDFKEVIRIAHQHSLALAQSGQEVIYDISQAAEDYKELQNRILSKSRPGDSAPRLLPTSGGVPQTATQSLGSMSNADVQAIIAAGLTTGNK